MSAKKYSKDFELFNRYIKGDNEAGRDLYEPIFQKLENFVYSITRNDKYLKTQDKRQKT
jgi:hypothetical protein